MKFVIWDKCPCNQKLKIVVGNYTQLNLLSKVTVSLLFEMFQKDVSHLKFIQVKIVILGNLQKFVLAKLTFFKFQSSQSFYYGKFVYLSNAQKSITKCFGFCEFYIRNDLISQCTSSKTDQDDKISLLETH